jgi:hypothetical protein
MIARFLARSSEQNQVSGTARYDQFVESLQNDHELDDFCSMRDCISTISRVQDQTYPENIVKTHYQGGGLELSPFEKPFAYTSPERMSFPLARQESDR